MLDRRPVLLALVLAGALPAAADVVIPSSAFSGGANDAQFQSDVGIFNPGSTPATVTPFLYDQATGGCADGLHSTRINMNQGAESTLAALSTLQLARRPALVAPR